MSAGAGTFNNPLLNRGLNLDAAMLMGILIELINSKPTSVLAIPQFRLDQLIKAASKMVAPVNERKTLEAVCALYCICLYYGLSTSYPKELVFNVMAIIQAVQSEALLIIQSIGGKGLAMPDLAIALQKDEHIDTAYKLEVFTEALAVAKLTCRDLYALMKHVFRVGRRGAQSLAYSADEKKKQAKYMECVQPYSVYFMCTFAYAHLATMLHSAQSLNIYPGTVECFMLMLLTTTPTAAATAKDKSHTQSGNTAEAIIRTVIEEEAKRKQQEEDPAAQKPLVVTLKLNFETFVETAHKLAVFVAHEIFDDRNLQEVRITHARLTRNFDHPDVAFAQFRASGAKALLMEDDLPATSSAVPGVNTRPSTSSQTAANGPGSAGGGGKGRGKAVGEDLDLEPAHPQVRPRQGLINTSASDPPMSHSKPAFAKAVVDITKPGYHLLSGASRPELWQVQDPSEADFDYQDDSGGGRYCPERKSGSKGHKGSVLPSLQFSRAGLLSPKGGRHPPSSGNGSVGGTQRRASTEGIGELPPPSGRITGRETPGRGRQRSARSGNGAASSDGGYSDSDAVSSTDEGGTATTFTSGKPSSLFSANPYAAPGHNRFHGSRQQKLTATAEEKTTLTMDQKITGYWAMGKAYRGAYLVLDSLHTRNPHFHAYFSDEYKPAAYELSPEQELNLLAPPSLRSKPVYEACKIMESQYYHLAAAVKLPRILDPSQDVFWICSYLIEHLGKKTTMGLGFRPSTEAELNAVKKQIKVLKSPADSRTAKVTTSATASAVTASSTMHGNALQLPRLSAASGVRDINRTSSPESRTRTAQKQRRYINIQDRLAAAALEANMESKAFEMQKKLWWEHSSPDSKHRSPTRSRVLSEFSEGDLIHPPASAVGNNKAGGTIPSVVWTCPPHKDKSRAATFIGQDDDELNENPFNETISKQVAMEYAKKLLEYKREKAEEEAQYKQYLADQQESVVARNRAAKEERIRQLREQTKNDLLQKSKFKQEWEVMQRKQVQLERARARVEEKEREENALRELMHVKEVKLLHEARLRQEEVQRQEALRLEAAKIQLMASEAEVEIINRQNREEARMRFLEERRRAIEDKKVQAEEVKRAKLRRKQQKTAEVRDRLQARIRMGAFKWHNGVYGYYDNVRPAPVEWIQYEDQYGNPYYFDPVTQTSQYREPQDADYHHHAEDERRAYDAIHGEGAYDAYIADRAFKDGVNRDGGYWDEKGVWVAVDGYYDENYEWVANEGYYDENGVYRKYAKVVGDLSFMV